MIEILGMALVLGLWILDMDRSLKVNEGTGGRYLLAYFLGFLILATYTVGIDMRFAFFFLLLGLVSILEFALIMLKKFR